MALMKRESWGGLSTLRRDMDRLLEDFFTETPFFGERERVFSPNVEVMDTKEAVIVKAQVPGVPQDALEVNVSDDSVTVKGEVKEDETKEEKTYYTREFRYGAFVRTVPLPTRVQSDKATATLKDGVLEITIPKSEEAKVKAIPIQT